MFWYSSFILKELTEIPLLESLNDDDKRSKMKIYLQTEKIFGLEYMQILFSFWNIHPHLKNQLKYIQYYMQEQKNPF